MFRVDQAQKLQEKENADFVSFVKSSQNRLLVYNSEIANKQQDLDHLRYSTTDYEAALSKGEVEAKQGTRQLGEIKMAIHNIHNRCVRTRMGPSPEALEAFLEAIKQRVVDLQAIVTGHDRPVGFQELNTIIRAKMLGGDENKSKPAADSSMSLPERLRGDKPTATASGQPAESTSPGANASQAKSTAGGGRGSTMRSGGRAAGDGDSSSLSAGPVSMSVRAAAT